MNAARISASRSVSRQVRLTSGKSSVAARSSLTRYRGLGVLLRAAGEVLTKTKPPGDPRGLIGGPRGPA